MNKSMLEYIMEEFSASEIAILISSTIIGNAIDNQTQTY
ncbi:MAG: hypothetical protein HUJ51_04990 [Eggerthellaceae bacterium]|nr:hypothetical protein [Eggerthellaceae bacterium]